MSDPQPQSRFCPTCRAVYSTQTEFCPKDGTQLEQPEKILAGRFVLKGLIGSGSMGTVHRAVQLPMGREVAIKLLHPELVRNPEMVARFEREALAASTVDHPNAITIYDSGRTDDGQVYIAMEYLQGESLSKLISQQRSIPPTRAIELWVPVVKAMIVAHRKGVVHRDIKPDNIFIARKLSEDGSDEAGGEVVKVLDFGIAKLAQGSRMGLQTVAGVRIGTAMYMAPEQLEGREASKTSDVYALGLVLMEMIAGRLPWGKTGTENDTMLTMLRLVNPAKSLAELCPGQSFSSELQQLFDDVLAQDPAQRPVDAAELLRRIASVPEATFLSQGLRRNDRSSEGSLLLSAAFMNAALPNLADLSLPPGNQPPADGSGVNGPNQSLVATIPIAREPRRPIIETPSELISVPTEVKRPDPPAVAALAAVPTEVKRPPKPAIASAPTALKHGSPSQTPGELPNVPTVVTAPRPSPDAPSQPGSSSDDLKPRRQSSDASTLPTAVPAPVLAVTKREPQAVNLAATLPSPVAAPKLPDIMPTVRSAGMPDSALPPTKAMPAARIAPLARMRRIPRRTLVLLVSGAAALALCVLVYVVLTRPHRPRETEQAQLPPPDLGVREPPRPLVQKPPPPEPSSSDASGEDPRDRDTRDAAKDPAPDTRKRPPDPPARPPKAERLPVRFVVRKPPAVSVVSCGGAVLRPCAETCFIGPGEQCTVSSPGFLTRRFDYEAVRQASRRGKARFEVTLAHAF